MHTLLYTRAGPLGGVGLWGATSHFKIPIPPPTSIPPHFFPTWIPTFCQKLRIFPPGKVCSFRIFSHFLLRVKSFWYVSWRIMCKRSWGSRKSLFLSDQSQFGASLPTFPPKKSKIPPTWFPLVFFAKKMRFFQKKCIVVEKTCFIFENELKKKKSIWRL